MLRKSATIALRTVILFEIRGPLPLVGVEMILILRGTEASIDSNTFLNLRFLRISHGEYN